MNIEGNDTRITAEVAQQIGDSRVRAICLKPTDGLTRGTIVTNLGRGLSMPVGDGVLGLDDLLEQILLPADLQVRVLALETKLDKKIKDIPPPAIQFPLRIGASLPIPEQPAQGRNPWKAAVSPSTGNVYVT